MEASWGNPLSGLWKPTQLQSLYYGPDSVKTHLTSTLPTPTSKAFIISTTSLTKTPLLRTLESILGPDHHAGTFTSIGQHAPIADLDAAASALLASSPTADTIISVGGGSPIDSAKAISHRTHERTGSFLFHIAIPTTLSAAECTMTAGFTSANKLKTAVSGPELVPRVLFYDAVFAAQTPPRLWLSSGLRAVDHAMETMYHATAAEVPTKMAALGAAGELFACLPRYRADPGDLDVITRLQLANFASLGFVGLNVKGGLGLSHALGYALGSPYGIPHGITSCLTLGHVVKLKARESPANAAQIARMAPFIGVTRSGDDEKDAEAVGQAVLDLVDALSLKTSLKQDHGVGEDQLDVIVRAATKQENGPLYDKVRELVQGLF